MTQIYQSFERLPVITQIASQTAQIDMPLILSEPIVLSGALNNPALLADIAKQLTSQQYLQDNIPVQFEIGIDEVGRGPLYGSVVVAAAILPQCYSGEIRSNKINTDGITQPQLTHTLLENTPLAQLTDSKKLTEIKRARLFPLLKQNALAYIIVEVPACVIDRINILQATLLGMRLACEQLMIEIVNVLNSPTTALYFNEGKKMGCELECKLGTQSEDRAFNKNINFKLRVDGNKVPDLDWDTLKQYDIGLKNNNVHCVDAEAWIKGDARHSAIAAASVLAKVTRDTQVINDGLANPGYGLEQHKGYPTKAHIEAIKRLGLLPKHRRSFKPVQQVLQNNS